MIAVQYQVTEALAFDFSTLNTSTLTQTNDRLAELISKLAPPGSQPPAPIGIRPQPQPQLLSQPQSQPPYVGSNPSMYPFGAASGIAMGPGSGQPSIPYSTGTYAARTANTQPAPYGIPSYYTAPGYPSHYH